jgi:site-specific DNA-cytosine methylase
MELTFEGNEWKATGKVVKQADGPRYKQMGNAVTVNVAEYLGKQIGKVLDK